MRLAPALPVRVRCRPRATQPGDVTDVDMPVRATDPPIDDWHDLFDAVTETLRSTLGATGADSTAAAAHDTSGQNEALVRECVAALEQLHATLRQEVGHCQQQRLDAQSALAQALDDLAGAREEPLFARYLVEHGGMTSLPDHGFFRERLDQALAAGASGQHAPAVLYVGLEGVDAVVERYGHGVGDELLVAVAARLSSAVRAEDLVSQFGEHEFACLLLDVRAREPLRHLACKLFDVLSAPFRIGALEIIVRPSIGVAMSTTDTASAAALLGHADAAMDRARKHGLGHAFHGDHADATDASGCAALVR